MEARAEAVKDPYEYDCDDESDESIRPIGEKPQEKRKYVNRHGGSSCCVTGCKNKSSQAASRKGLQVSFHKFPSAASDYHEAWKAAIGRPDMSVSVSTKVCSNHFRDSDFYSKAGGNCRCRRLLPSAVPSLSSAVRDADCNLIAPPQPIIASNSSPQDIEPRVPRLFESFLTEPQSDVSIGLSTSFLAPSAPAMMHHSTPRSNKKAQQDGASSFVLSTSSDFRTINEWREYSGDIRNVSDQFKAAAAAKDAEIASLNLRLEHLAAEMKSLSALSDKLAEDTFSFERLRQDSAKLKYYTGFAPDVFEAVLSFLDPAVIQRQLHPSYLCKDPTKRRGRPPAKSPEDMLLLTLARLKRGLGLQDLAFRMHISVSTVSTVFNNMVSHMYAKFRETNIWPSRAQVDRFMPSSFKQQFPSTRIIIDATEIPTGRPQDPVLQQYLYSNYKSCHTWKGLVGISPGGAVTFVSELYGGSITDAKLTEESGLLSLLESGDSVLADRGFLCAEMLKRIGVTLEKPPTLFGRPHFDDADVVRTRQIANCRIFVEHVMRRLKIWRILDYIHASMHGMASQIFYLCGYMSNFADPLVPPESDLYLSDDDDYDE